MKEVNLEKGYPKVTEALILVKNEVEIAPKGEIIVFIHGYGSSGVGGKIRLETRSWLKAQEKNGVISKVVIGEEFDMFDSKSRDIKNKDEETKKYYGKINQGITIIEK